MSLPFSPAEAVLQHRRVEALPLAQLAGGGHAGHDPEVGVDHAGAVAVRAGALGVGAEQGRLHAVGLGERLADRLEQAGVGGRVAPPRTADRALVDRHHPVAAGDRAVDQRALAGARHAGHDGQHAEGDVDVDIAQVVGRRPADLQRPRRRAHRRLQRRPVVEVAAGQRPARAQPVEAALEHDLATGGTGARAEIDDVVGDRDRLRLVLHDEHGVALVAQLQQQRVHPRDVVRVQADRRLVEDVGDVGERGAEVADHLGALRLAARERARRPVEREVAQPDLDERVEGVAQGREQGPDRRLVEAAHPHGEVGDLHLAGVGDVDPGDLRRAGLGGQARAVAVGAGGEGGRALDEGPDVRLKRVDVLGEERLLDLRDQAEVGQVDALDLDLRGLLVQEVVQLPLRELADRLVRVEEARSRGRCARTSPPCCMPGIVIAPSLSDLVAS